MWKSAAISDIFPNGYIFHLDNETTKCKRTLFSMGEENGSSFIHSFMLAPSQAKVSIYLPDVWD